jgi:hypothetical protein
MLSVFMLNVIKSSVLVLLVLFRVALYKTYFFVFHKDALFHYCRWRKRQNALNDRMCKRTLMFQMELLRNRLEQIQAFHASTPGANVIKLFKAASYDFS